MSASAEIARRTRAPAAAPLTVVMSFPDSSARSAAEGLPAASRGRSRSS